MITRVQICEKDKYVLSEINRSSKKKEYSQPVSYKHRVVVKPWGYEFLIFENECVAIWQLHIKNQHATSMHCHPNKKTCLSVLEGKALSNTFEKRQNLSAGHSTIIDKAVFHSSKALSESGCVLMELETPPDKTDLVRLNDAYGRQKEGYEGLSEMEQVNLDLFGYYYLDEPNTPDGQVVYNSGCEIKIACFNNSDELSEQFFLSKDANYQICRGAIIDESSQKKYDVGDAFSTNDVNNVNSLNCISKTVILSIKVSPNENS